jgi:sulfur carrier protein ThiS
VKGFERGEGSLRRFRFQQNNAKHRTRNAKHYLSVPTMKITVESLGLPTLSAVIGKKAELEFTGRTVADLVDQLVGRFGPKARRVLLDGEGRLDLTIQVMVNDEGFLNRGDLPGRELKDGDRIRFMLLVGGG